MSRPSFGGKQSTDRDYARYQIFKSTKSKPAGVRVEELIGLKKAKARVGFLMRGLQRDGDIQYEIRPMSNVGMTRMAWEK